MRLLACALLLSCAHTPPSPGQNSATLSFTEDGLDRGSFSLAQLKRRVPFLRAWIRNPFAFRISVMPPSPHLSEAELDALLAYLASMKDSKIDVTAMGGH
ncbi:MAG: hypothetical protein Q8N23_00645 [Archangium sp.]|nr:hypothetical protein [Archangium sp.]MDP3151142.1 hypothetical protein [Archangium sp.]MDP3571826.1 hypothetical protein [Archangium sp.]